MYSLARLTLGLWAWGIYLLPHPLRRLKGRSLGFWLRVLGLRSGVVRENLERAFPGHGPEAVAKREVLYRESYANFGHLIIEILLLFGPLKQFVIRNIELRGIQHWHEARKVNRGVIMLSNHVGNWELMLAAGGVLGLMDILLVSKVVKPRWFHRLIEEARARCGISATYEPRTMREVLTHLKKNGTVGFAFDQYTGPPVSVRVPVFGIPVGTSLALAAIARRTRAVVLPATNYRTPQGRTVVEIGPPIAWEPRENANEELAVNTARYAAVVERDIYAHPEQWLWIHRRFKGDLSPLRSGEWAQERARE